jgi:hypothetical protein
MQEVCNGAHWLVKEAPLYVLTDRGELGVSPVGVV